MYPCKPTILGQGTLTYENRQKNLQVDNIGKMCFT